jgi:hypothetical protein
METQFSSVPAILPGQLLSALFALIGNFQSLKVYHSTLRHLLHQPKSSSGSEMCPETMAAPSSRLEMNYQTALTQKGRSGARKIKRANILLLANTGKLDFENAELLHTSWLTVLRTRHRFVEGGLDFALNELPRAGRWPKIDDKIETILTTLAQSQPPGWERALDVATAS